MDCINPCNHASEEDDEDEEDEEEEDAVVEIETAGCSTREYFSKGFCDGSLSGV
jgi:hypothetical protein